MGANPPPPTLGKMISFGIVLGRFNIILEFLRFRTKIRRITLQKKNSGKSYTPTPTF